MKAHARIYRNKIADRLAKEATQKYYAAYSRIPSTTKKDTQKESIRRWQNQWEETTKGAITKDFFSKCRLAVKRKLSPNVITILTSHGNILSYIDYKLFNV